MSEMEHIHHLNKEGTACEKCAAPVPADVLKRRRRYERGEHDVLDYVSAMVPSVREGSAVIKNGVLFVDGEAQDNVPRYVVGLIELAAKLNGAGVKCDTVKQ